MYQYKAKLVRVVDGQLSIGDKVRVMSSERDFLVDQLGVFTPKRSPKKSLLTGEVGYVVAGIKDIDGAPVGDTLTLSNSPASEALPGFQTIKPRVFSGLFPIDSADYESFREALSKLKLN